MPKVATGAKRADGGQGGGEKIKKSKQTSIFGALTIVKKEVLLIGKDLLLSDEIYPGRIPDEMKNKLFHYTVSGYDITRQFSLLYMNQMLEENGVEWIHQDGGRETMSNVSMDAVTLGINRYGTAITRIQEFERAKVATAREVLKEKSSSCEGAIDFSDLDVAAANSEKGWFGVEVIEVDFELSGKTGYDVAHLSFVHPFKVMSWY
jgi:hypothetical protein